MRLSDSGANDQLFVGNNTTLDGELSLSGVNTISTIQFWTIISTSGTISGDFSLFTWPDNVNNSGPAATLGNLGELAPSIICQ
jgi:hypothetical protein